MLTYFDHFNMNMINYTDPFDGIGVIGPIITMHCFCKRVIIDNDKIRHLEVHNTRATVHCIGIANRLLFTPGE